jgi:hypothetical protein
MKEKKMEKTTRGKLAALQAEREKLQAAHFAARKAVGHHERELVTAEGDLAVAAATAASSWLDRRAERKAEAAVADVRAKLDEARARAKEAEAALDPIEDQIIELQVGAVEPEIRAARKKAAELKALLREQQEAVLSTARQAVALYKAAAAKTPPRLVSMRSEKFLKVEITNPVVCALYRGPSSEGDRLNPKPPTIPESVFLHFEFFKARDGEKKGRWKVVPGQDPRPGKVERIYEDGPMPDEIESIKEIELGRLTTVNGRARTEQEKADLDFRFIEGLVTEEELRQAAQIIEEGV